MNKFVAAGTNRDEILFFITSQSAAWLDVMDLEIG